MRRHGGLRGTNRQAFQRGAGALRRSWLLEPPSLWPAQPQLFGGRLLRNKAPLVRDGRLRNRAVKPLRFRGPRWHALSTPGERALGLAKISIRSLGIEQQSLVQFPLPLLKPTLHEQGRSKLRVKQWQRRLLRCSFL